MILLLLMGSMVSNVYARHFIRFNVDFSYARDFARKDAQIPAGEEMSLDDAKQWIGAGSAEAISSSVGWSPAAGFGYRYMYKAFVLDLGLGLEYRYRTNRPYAISHVVAPGTDDTGEPYTGTHTWDNRRTTMQHVGVNLPIMLGADIKGFYFLLGLKANIDIWGRTQEDGAYTMTAKYDRYMDEWENVAGHGFVTDADYETSPIAAGAAWDIRACGEIGYRFCQNYCAGAFVEYGFAGSANHYLPLLAGLRLTALIPLPEKKICMCLPDY